MTYRTIAFFALLLALVGLAVYWYVSRPTPEEKSLRGFFDEFRRGKYAEAQEYTVGGDFYRMAADTSVRDTDGSQYVIGTYFPPNRKDILQFSIETYVRRHIARWKYLFMETTDMSDTSSVVHFRIAISIRDFTSGEGAFGAVHSGTVEGNAYMTPVGEEWRLQKFELYLVSDEGLVLADYLSRAQ
jgi:hypothetical protein